MLAGIEELKSARRVRKARLTKESIRALAWSDANDRLEEVEPHLNALQLLNCECEIDHDVTLGDVLKIVKQNPDLARVVGGWSRCDIDAYHAEAFLRESEQSYPPLQCIEITKSLTWEEDLIETQMAVYGLGDPVCTTSNGVLDHTHYAIWLTPTDELVKVPVRLRRTMFILKEDVAIGEAPCAFTLLDVLGGLYFEISWGGVTPNLRDRRRNEFNKSDGDGFVR